MYVNNIQFHVIIELKVNKSKKHNFNYNNVRN